MKVVSKKTTMEIVQWRPDEPDKQEKPQWFLDAEESGNIVQNGHLLTVQCENGPRQVEPGNYVAIDEEGKFWARTKLTIEHQWEEFKEPLTYSLIDDTEDGIEVVISPGEDQTRIRIEGPLSVMIAGQIIEAIG